MDTLLFGHNPETHIVGVQQISDSTMRVHTRKPDGVQYRDEEFYPFFFLSDPSYLKGFEPKHWTRELTGSDYFRYLCAFTRWSEMWDAVHYIIDLYTTSTQSRIESYTDLPVVHIRPDPVSQFLMQSGRTLFKDMAFGDLYRMQLDIETYTKPGANFSNAERKEDRIILIALRDSKGWEHVINGKELTEREMLLELIRIISEKDPDAIEGHNILGFDLPYIIRRCEALEVEFGVGRGGLPMRVSDQRAASGERLIEQPVFEIPGRHIVDTLLLLQAYDNARRQLESYGLKYAARFFGFASPERTYIPGEKISWYWDNDPDALVRYALDDVRETEQLSRLLSPSSFHLSQMVPYNYGTIARMGSTAKIESMMLREYVRQKHSIPRPEAGIQTTGGYTDVFWTGILSPIVHVDIESLYPSIMISERIAPRRDTLSCFLSLLERLTQMRLEAKRRMTGAATPSERATLDATQSSLKILINSFYGYMGYSRALFNDFGAADDVTRTGQKLLKQLISSIRANQGVVVEVDTDGIMFAPPPEVRSEDAEVQFVRSAASVLPPAIHLKVEGRYRKMLSYKKKNYAIQDYEGTVTIKGSSLVSRSMENFGKQFIRNCINALLDADVSGLHELYLEVHKKIASRALGIGEFARTETLRDSMEVYSNEVEAGKRNRSANYEAALSAGRRWRPGDKISYYIVGNEMSVKGFENSKLADEWDPNFPDENTAYYLKRLDEFSRKFELFFTPQHHRAIFSLEDLFPFSPQGIEILTAPIEKIAPVDEEDSDDLPPDPRIWLQEE